MISTGNLPKEPEPKSWADTIKDYEARTRGKGFPGKEWEVKRVSAVERKQKESEVNLVTMAYRDPAKEQIYENTRKVNMEATKEKAESAIKSKFNFVTHEGPPRKLPQSAPHENHRTRDFNFVTNLPLEAQSNASIYFNPEYNQKYAHRPKALLPESLSNKVSNAGGRDLNILNNRYLVHHSARVEEEQQQVKSRLKDKYWQTHNYHPILCQFYDPVKENDFQEKLKIVQSSAGVVQSSKLPARTLLSEGNTYNIISNEVSDPIKLGALLAEKDKALQRLMHTEIVDRIQELSDARDSREEARKLNRIRWDRRGDEERPYNPITFEPSLSGSLSSIPFMANDQDPKHSVAHVPDYVEPVTNMPYAPSMSRTLGRSTKLPAVPSIHQHGVGKRLVPSLPIGNGGLDDASIELYRNPAQGGGSVSVRTGGWNTQK